jgi:hypothetical protein
MSTDVDTTGTCPGQGSGPGQSNQPTGRSVDGRPLVDVPDVTNERVQVLTRAGDWTTSRRRGTGGSARRQPENQPQRSDVTARTKATPDCDSTVDVGFRRLAGVDAGGSLVDAPARCDGSGRS